MQVPTNERWDWGSLLKFFFNETKVQESFLLSIVTLLII